MKRLATGVILLLPLLGTALSLHYTAPKALPEEQPKPPPAKDTAVRLATENEALALAATDLGQIPPLFRRYMRYLWITDGVFQNAQAVNLTVNYLSRATLIVRGEVLGKDRLMLVRLDLRDYAPRHRDLEEWLRLWEEFQYDPRFNLLLTPDTVRFNLPGLDVHHGRKGDKGNLGDVQGVGGKGGPPAVVEYDWRPGKVHYQGSGPFTFPDDSGRTLSEGQFREWAKGNGYAGSLAGDYTVQLKFKKLPKDVPPGKHEDVVRLVSPHLDPKLVEFLVEWTGSQAPVVSHPYFLFRTLSAIQDDGVYQVVWGGLYYEFVGIRESKVQGATDEDQFLEDLGVGSVDGKVNAKRLFERLRSDQRVAVWRSGITGSPRRIDVFPTLATRPSDGASLVSVTHDIKAKQVDIGTRSMMNLLEFQDDAREVIATTTTGLNKFALFNGQGKLQRVVPPDVAVDRDVPSPHRAELQPAIGCIRCHARDDGWRTLTNDVKTLAKVLVPFDDLTQKYKSQEDIQNRLAGLYTGDLELKALPHTRQNYASSVMRATGSWKGTKLANADIVKLASDQLAKEYGKFWYQEVTAETVLADLGLPPAKDLKAAQATLARLLPPLPAGEEDARIGQLMVGGLNRSDYDLVYSFIASRVQLARAAQK